MTGTMSARPAAPSGEVNRFDGLDTKPPIQWARLFPRTSPVSKHCGTLVLPRRTNLKTVRDACELQPNALSIKLSDQIEQLDQLITAEGDGTEFFGKTQITQGMQDLISEGVARLAGASSQAVFHLKQAMGGGKTHLLVGFGLLARHAELRKTYCAGMPHASAFKGSSIAAFNGRNNPEQFFW